MQTTTKAQARASAKDIRKSRFTFMQLPMLSYEMFARMVRTHYDDIDTLLRRTDVSEECGKAIAEDWDQINPITFAEAVAEEDRRLRRAMFVALRPDRLFSTDQPDVTVLDEVNENMGRLVLGTDLQYTHQEVPRRYQIVSRSFELSDGQHQIRALRCWDTSREDKCHVLLTRGYIENVHDAMKQALPSTHDPYNIAIGSGMRFIRHGDLLFGLTRDSAVADYGFKLNSAGEVSLNIITEDMDQPGLRQAVSDYLGNDCSQLQLDLNLGTSRHIVATKGSVSFTRAVTSNHGTMPLLRVRDQPAFLLHPEHAPLKLLPGEYPTFVMLEFDPWADSMVYVFD
jgi:hypothetical protein